MIQIDMPMPKNCFECPVCNEYLCCAVPVGGHGWGENNVSDFSKSRPEWCPMKEQEAEEPHPWEHIWDAPDYTFKGRCRNCGFIHYFVQGHDAQYRFCPQCGEQKVI